MPSAPLDADRGSGPGPAPRRALGLLALFYFAHFSALGAYNPLFPRWLEARGIEGLAMGAAAATSPAMGLVAPPVFGFLADTLGLRGWLLRVVCAGACLASGAIALSAALGAGAGALFLAIAAFAFCRVPIIPMTDVVALEHIRRAGMPYARLRVWGSVGFALTATAAGSWIDPRDPAALPALIAAAYGVAFVVSFGLPARAPTPPRPVPEHVRALLRGTDFRLFLAVSFLAQGAHAAHDLCLTLHLRDLGFPLGLAGGAWAAGVLAEVLLMAFGGRRVARASQPKLLAASLAGAALRWALLATVRSPAALLALQPLHAVSFGLMWLASIGYLDRRAPPYARATAQGLFTASVCAGSVIGLVVWGPLYERAGGAVTFGAASAVAGLAFVLAIPFCRRSDAAGESSAGAPAVPARVQFFPPRSAGRSNFVRSPARVGAAEHQEEAAMCGIVGYVGSKKAAPIIVDGLRKLEYRGYDSAGIAIHDGKGIEIVRTLGKLIKLSEALEKRTLEGSTGIGHTRWATHGRPSEVNAHPHSSGPVALVHNGIIENYVAVRQQLEAQGVKFASDTDTEVVAHLVNRELQKGAKPLFEAVRGALRQVHGAYAIAVISRDEPGVIVAARSGSPLVIGRGEDEMLCGSDIPALLAHTRDMIFLEDGDIVELHADSFRVETVAGEKVERRSKRIDWSPVQAERGGFKHFMLKEIHEQPDVVEATLRGRIDLVAGDVHATEMGVTPEFARELRRVYITACGTSHHAGIAGRYWIEQLARVPAVVELASEVRYREPLFYPDDLVIAISQSGETADTIAALKAAKAQGAKVLALCNVLDSAIPRLSDGALYTHAGPEIGVASTKCFTTQLAALLLLAVYLGRRRDTLPQARAKEILQALWEIPNHMREVLGDADYMHAIAKRLTHAKDVLFLGRGLGYPIALEGALKLKEISYAHAEGYAAGEMKHGPIALIDENLPVIVVCPRDAHYDKTFSNLEEVRAREGQVIAIATKGDESILETAQHHVWLPKVPDEVLPLLTVLPLQLISYFVANLKGNDVDQPRNLAKTVTVE